MPALTPERLEQVKENIELAAIACFTRKGFHGTTTRDIAKGAGVSTGAMYAHYKGKDQLFAAVIARYRRIFAQPDNPLIAYFSTSRFPDDIGDMAVAIESVIRTHKSFWLLWYVDVLEFGAKHFADTFLQDVGLDHPSLVAHFDALEAKGRLRMPPRLAFRLVYMHLFNHMLVEILFRNSPPGVATREEVTAITDISLRGIIR